MKKRKIDDESVEQILKETIGDFEDKPSVVDNRSVKRKSKKDEQSFSERDMIRYLWDEKRRLEREVDSLKSKLREFKDREIERKIQSWNDESAVDLPQQLKFDPSFAQKESKKEKKQKQEG